MDTEGPPAAGKGLKRPRPTNVGLASLTELPDLDTPDLAEFQRSFDLSDDEMIRLCTAYASYLKACLRRKR